MKNLQLHILPKQKQKIPEKGIFYSKIQFHGYEIKFYNYS